MEIQETFYGEDLVSIRNVTITGHVSDIRVMRQGLRVYALPYAEMQNVNSWEDGTTSFDVTRRLATERGLDYDEFS